MLLVLLSAVPAAAETRATIQTDDGATLTGTILAETKEGYLFKPDGAAARVIPFGKIVNLQQGEASPAPPPASTTAPVHATPAQPSQPAGPAPAPANPPSPAVPSPQPAATPAPATPTKEVKAEAPKPAAEVRHLRPGLAFYSGLGINSALVISPISLYPFLSADVLMGFRFPDSEYGLVGMSGAALGLRGFSPWLGLGLLHDIDDGTAYAGLTHTIETDDVCLQAVVQGGEAGSWMFRGGWCVKVGDSSNSHIALGVGVGFGT